jgi:AcrR family transcriptional regulator
MGSLAPAEGHGTRLAADQRREAVLAAAQTVFARLGYRGASTAEIAATCGCSEPVLYKHFAGKRDLFVAVLRRRSDTAQQHLEQLAESERPLEALLDHLRDKFADPEWIELVRLRLVAVAASASEPEIGATLRDVLDGLRSGFAAVFRRAQALGQLRADADPDQIAWIWMATVLSGGIRHALDPERAGRELPATIAELVHLVEAPSKEPSP